MNIEKIKLAMRAIDIDFDEMTSRFMDSEEMFLRYFGKFFTAAEPVVAELGEAVEQSDWKLIEERAHALKSLSGNIGLNGVFVPAKKLVDDMRENVHDTYQADYKKLKESYEGAKAVAGLLD